jgi:hypothetical protein
VAAAFSARERLSKIYFLIDCLMSPTAALTAYSDACRLVSARNGFKHEQKMVALSEKEWC